MIFNFLFVALLVVVGATAFRQPSWILQYAGPSGLLSLFFLLLFFWNGSIRLGEREKAISFPKYLSLLALAQGALCLIMTAIVLAFVGGSQNTEALGIIQFLIKQNYLSHWALFPWGLFGLWALMIAYVYYNKQAYPLIGNVLRLFFPTRFEAVIKNLIDYITSASTLLCLALSLAAAIELISRFIEMQLGFQTNNDWMRVVILGCLYPVFFWSLKSKAFLKFSKKLSLAQLPCLTTVCMVPILVFSGFMAQGYIAHLPKSMSLLKGVCFQPLDDSMSMQTRLLGLLWGGWILWMPLAGSLIARLSCGRTLREIIIGVLYFPGLCFLGFHFFSPAIIHVIAKIFNFKIYILLGLFVIGILAWMMRGMKNNLFLYAGWMLLPNPPKTSRTDLQWAPKLAGMKKCYLTIIMAVFAILLSDAIGGWFFISFQVLSVAAFMISILYIAIISTGLYRVNRLSQRYPFKLYQRLFKE